MNRSSKPETRNPVLALPEARELAALLAQQSPELRAAVERLLGAMAASSRAKGNAAWAKHKPPMAAYWKAWAVNWRHLRLALRGCQEK